MLASLAVALVLAMAAGVSLGAVAVPPAELFAAVGRALRGVPGPVSDAVVVDLRLPRVLLAALVGASLAGAGVLYQALFRNPLADPFILGVSSGAGLGVTAVLAATAGATGLRLVGVPAAAFAGALATIVLVAGLARREGRMDVASLLLAGIAVSYTLAALTSFLLVFAKQSMASVVFWMMGGLTGASWGQLRMVAPMFALGAVVPLLTARELNIVLLGDERASQLGVDVERLKRALLAAGSLLVAGAVAVSGLVGFVGLMTPHMVRLAFGPDHRLVTPASLLAGATAMVLADLAARTVLAPVELPVGIVTALAGGPFFVWLLLRHGRRA
ncbi:MAG: iron ABC transporter permease [Coriobacteriia bacterium]|nr:iron ABC transporter permease [Coriobacteriia bacterium]